MELVNTTNINFDRISPSPIRQKKIRLEIGVANWVSCLELSTNVKLQHCWDTHTHKTLVDQVSINGIQCESKGNNRFDFFCHSLLRIELFCSFRFKGGVRLFKVKFYVCTMDRWTHTLFVQCKPPLHGNTHSFGLPECLSSAIFFAVVPVVVAILLVIFYLSI